MPKRVIQSKTSTDDVFDASIDKIGTVIQSRESDVIINAKVPEVEVTVSKDIDDDTDEVIDEKMDIDKGIKDEVGKDLPIPDFKLPNSLKSTERDEFKSLAEENANRLEGINTALSNFGGSSTTQVMSSDINDPNSPYNRNNNPDRN